MGVAFEVASGLGHEQDERTAPKDMHVALRARTPTPGVQQLQCDHESPSVQSPRSDQFAVQLDWLT